MVIIIIYYTLFLYLDTGESGKEVKGIMNGFFVNIKYIAFWGKSVVESGNQTCIFLYALIVILSIPK